MIRKPEDVLRLIAAARGDARSRGRIGRVTPTATKQRELEGAARAAEHEGLAIDRRARHIDLRARDRLVVGVDDDAANRRSASKLEGQRCGRRIGRWRTKLADARDEAICVHGDAMCDRSKTDDRKRPVVRGRDPGGVGADATCSATLAN